MASRRNRRVVVLGQPPIPAILIYPLVLVNITDTSCAFRVGSPPDGVGSLGDNIPVLSGLPTGMYAQDMSSGVKAPATSFDAVDLGGGEWAVEYQFDSTPSPGVRFVVPVWESGFKLSQYGFLGPGLFEI